MSFKNILIGIAVFILAILVVIYGIKTFYPQPNQDTYCGKNLWDVGNESACVSAGGVWNNTSNIGPKGEVYPVQACQSPAGCYTQYENIMQGYSKWLFIISIPLGILIIVLGALVFGLEAVGAGLMASGVFTIIYGASFYWQYSGNVLRFILSLVGLCAVIGFAYWLNKRSQKKVSKKRR